MLHLLFEDGNSELKGRNFPLGNGIRKHLETTLSNYNGDKTSKGYKRLNNVLSSQNGVSYAEMKRIKNFFDNYNGTKKSDEYILNGGDNMKLWVNNTLNTATTQIHDFKQAKKDAGIKNAFRREHNKDRQTKSTKPTSAKIKSGDVNKKIANGNLIQFESENKTKVRRVVLTEKQLKEIQTDI